MDDIKPCPGCGAPALLEEDNDHHGEWFNLGCSNHWGNPKVKGEPCCFGRIWYTESPENKQKAIKSWNTRVDNFENQF